MQLIRSNRPETSLRSNRLQEWFRAPFESNRNWPALFDWDSLWENFMPRGGLAADLFEDEEAYHVRMEMPGVKKKDVRVELENAVLTVSYTQHHAQGKNADDLAETGTRSVALPDGTVPEKVRAKLKDGILHITLPKAESSKPRQIAVN